MDDMESDKHVKSMLPEDSRIKIINVSKRDANKDLVKYPFGQKLNLGVKYAKYNLICHFFDTHLYATKSFRDVVKCYIMSNKDAIISGDSGFANSMSVNVPDLGNMMYNKLFWKAKPFLEAESDSNTLMYTFTYFRESCIAYTPFIYHSFKYDKEYERLDVKQLPIDVYALLDDQVRKFIST